MYEYIGIILNSAAVITVSAALYKAVKSARKTEAEMKEEIFEFVRKVNERNGEVQRKICDLSEEIKQGHMKSLEERQPLSEKVFEDCLTTMVFSGGIEIKEKQLDYIAEVVIKTIASELPEKKRTPEVVEEDSVQGKRERFKSQYKDLKFSKKGELSW